MQGNAGGSGGGGSSPAGVGHRAAGGQSAVTERFTPAFGGATPSQCGKGVLAMRYTPASAGRPEVRLPGQFSIQVYPRVRRGDRRVNPGARALPWYIPALARGALRLKPTIEETSGPSLRLRGSALWGVALLWFEGLSPSLRGVLGDCHFNSPSDWSIPSLAGVSPGGAECCPRGGVHPCACGGGALWVVVLFQLGLVPPDSGPRVLGSHGGPALCAGAVLLGLMPMGGGGWGYILGGHRRRRCLVPSGLSWPV